MNDKTRQILISVLMGLSAGLFMSILVLYMMIESFFEITSFGFLCTAFACCALPLCLTFLYRTQWRVFLVQCTMILTSFIITLIYGGFVTYSGAGASSLPSLWIQVLSASALLHGLSLASTGISAWIYRRHAQ